MATATTERPTDQQPTTGHYRAYTPRPFTRAERDSVTILFGGLHWRVERILQAVLESGGHKAQVLPVATKDDLLTGREVADIGQCCPTSFTTGNLVNFLKKEAKATSAASVNEKFVYLTAGSCGACRFGQYHQSYELALRNSGLDAFRMFLLAQDQLDQKAEMGDGLALNLPVTLGCLWAIFCTDLVQDLEYQVRPFEVVQNIQREADSRFSAKQRELQDKLKATEAKIKDLKSDKAGNVHAAIGKVSFAADALESNFTAFMDQIVRAKPAAAKGVYVKNVSVSSTMGPGVTIDINPYRG